MGIRQWFESPYRPGQKLTVDEYYGWIFENSVPGLPEVAAKEGLKPLEYMRKYGAYEVTTDVYKQNEKPVAPADLAGSRVEANGVVTKQGKAVGVMVESKAVVGYNTPSRKLELFSKTMADWKWPEFVLPEYYRSHIHRSAQAASVGNLADTSGADFDPQYMPLVEWPKDAKGEIYTLLPIFRFASSHPHAIGQLEISLRDRAQESALAESNRRQETRRYTHGRLAQGAHRNRLLRAPRLGHRGSRSRRRSLFSSHGPLAY